MTEADGPQPPLSRLVAALQYLHRAAGKPSSRTVSKAIADRDDLRDTVSHEAVSSMLRGAALIRWSKLEVVVRQLSSWDVASDESTDELVRRFHTLWLAAADAAAHPEAPTTPADVMPVLVDEVHAPPPIVDPAAPARDVGPEPEPRHPDGMRPVELPARLRYFVGRAELLAQISESLRQSPSGSVLLWGAGGMGKTSLALEFAHRVLGEYDLVWWIPSGRLADARSAYRRLAERLGIDAEGNVASVVSAVNDVLEASSLRWLLIFDNVDDMDALQAIAPATGGHVIFTSRLDGAIDASVVQVGAFRRVESVDFLRSRDIQLTVPEADELADMLGDHPLAVSQLVAVQSTTRMAFSRYADLFAGHTPALLEQGRAPAYPIPLAVFVDLAVATVNGANPMAAQLLELFPHLAPEPVPVQMLRAGHGGELTPTLKRCLGDLRRLQASCTDLARVGLVDHRPDEGMLHMHRLVRECLAQRLDDAVLERGRRNVWALLTEVNPGTPDDVRSWHVHAEIAPHVAPSGVISSPLKKSRHVVLDQARYLYRIGEYEQSRALAALALQAWAGADHGGLGTEDEDVVTAARHLANALRAVGEYEESRTLTAHTLERLRQPPAHRQDTRLIVEVATAAGYDQRIAGMYRDALALDEENLRLSETVNGPTHSRTLRIANNYADGLRSMGRFQEALVRDRATRQARIDQFGADDLSVLTTSLNLAWDFYGLGWFEDMLATARTLTRELGSRLATGHMSAVLARRTLVVALRCTGALEEALHAARECSDQHRYYLGDRHEQTLAARISYVNVLMDTEQYESALELARETEEAYRRRSGWAHPLTSVASLQVGSLLRAQGKLRDAGAVHERVLVQLERALGTTHPFVAAAANGLAGDARLRGDHGRAADLVTRAGDVVRRMRAPEFGGVENASAERRIEHNRAMVAAASDRDSAEPVRAFAEYLTSPEGAIGRWAELEIEPPPS